MDEQRLLDIIMELTRENERLKLKLEQYEDKEKVASGLTDLWNDDKFWKI
ncbi:hypothetical protein [Clostridium sp. BJN0001]|nr:hypothetical protein [Clostridium sp. BJN0001]